MRALLLAGVVAVSWAGVSEAAVIDFDTLAGANGDAFTTYEENGLTVAALSGAPKVAKFSGNPAPDIFFDLSGGMSGSISVSSGGQFFTFTSVDVRSGSNSTNTINYTITGFLGAMQAFTQSGSAAGGPPNTSFLTVAALQPGTLIDSLVISESAGVGAVSGNLDNIVVQTVPTDVPEPASLALLGVGLAGIAAVRRRRAA